jgi:DNA-binding NarL/FixJ family response regulator
MRTLVDLSSQVSRSLRKSVSTGQEQRELPMHPAPAIAQSGHTHATMRTRASSARSHSDLEATAGNRGDTKIDDRPGIQHSTGRNDDGTRSNKPEKPVIVIIHGRTVFRDCLAQCLEIAYVDHDVRAFSSIIEWLTCEEPATLDAAVTIIVIDGFNDAGGTDLDFLETSTMTNPMIVISDTDDLNHIVRVLKSGARGYIPTSLSFNVAVEAVRLVKAGGIFIPASSIVPDGGEPAQSKNSALLTHRQMEVVEEIRHGKANKQIAYELNMSEHTVKVHLRHIMRKLKARNRTEVAVLSGNLVTGQKDAPKAEHRVRSGDDAADDPVA